MNWARKIYRSEKRRGVVAKLNAADMGMAYDFEIVNRAEKFQVLFQYVGGKESKGPEFDSLEDAKAYCEGEVDKKMSPSKPSSIIGF